MDNGLLNRGSREHRERLLTDPYRPGYHFCVPDGDGRPGDPNGCFFADGRHHLMYLYRRDGQSFCWGHVSSIDLVHWHHHADALVRAEGDEGCFSGGAFVDGDGTAYLSFWIYTRANPASGKAGIGIAKSNPPYETWERMEDAAIKSAEWGIAMRDGRPVGCADPSNIWKADGMYYMQAGNLLALDRYGRKEDSPAEMRGDWTELFASRDLKTWTHRGRFYERRGDNSWTDETEDDMCPSFLPLPAKADGGEPTKEYLQLFISHNRGCQYYIGAYERERFYPREHGRMSWTDRAFFAPEAYMDGRGRQIMFAWLNDNLPNDFEKYGWSGVFSLPRTLWLGEDGRLRLAPAQETERLAFRHQVFEGEELDVHCPRSCKLLLHGCMGNQRRVGLRIGSAAHFVEVYYDAQLRQLVMDASQSGSLRGGFCERAPLFAADQAIHMTVYIDRAVIEVFVNDLQAISRRVYFENPENVRISRIGSMRAEAWEMMPAMPY